VSRGPLPPAFALAISQAIPYALGMAGNDDTNELEVGTFHIADASKLFELLEGEGVRFSFETSETGVKEMGPAMAALGGTFGHGVRIRLWVHREDLEHFEALNARCFGLSEEETKE